MPYQNNFVYQCYQCLPINFANGSFSCKKTKIWESLVSDVINQFNHGGANSRIKFRPRRTDFPSFDDELTSFL